MKLINVKFHPEGDGCEALYVDGRCVLHGDEYHDKIQARMEGFVDGLNFFAGRVAALKLEPEVVNIPLARCRNIVEGGDQPPLKWPAKKYLPKVKRP